MFFQLFSITNAENYYFDQRLGCAVLVKIIQHLAFSWISFWMSGIRIPSVLRLFCEINLIWLDSRRQCSNPWPQDVLPERMDELVMLENHQSRPKMRMRMWMWMWIWMRVCHKIRRKIQRVNGWQRMSEMTLFIKKIKTNILNQKYEFCRCSSLFFKLARKLILKV